MAIAIVALPTPLYLGLAATMVGIIIGLFAMPSMTDRNFSLAIDSLISDDISATISHIKSSILIAQGKYADAEQELPKIDSLDLEFAAWVIPFTYLNLAEIHFYTRDTEKVLDYLDLAESNNDYQKQNLIKSLINGLRYRIKDN